jgi:hypothetical protein
VGAAEDVPHEEFFDASRFTPDRFAPRHRRKRHKSYRTVPDAAGEVDFLEHSFFAKCVLTNRISHGFPKSVNKFVAYAQTFSDRARKMSDEHWRGQPATIEIELVEPRE